MPRNLTYFASDVHLGLQVSDPAGREARFVSFLRSIPAAETEALYLLGDIWDFWYEYRDVVPKGYVRVFGALTDLMDAGVKVYFFPGNHDIWAYGYFEELGMKILEQPYVTEIGHLPQSLPAGMFQRPAPLVRLPAGQRLVAPLPPGQEHRLCLQRGGGAAVQVLRVLQWRARRFRRASGGHLPLRPLPLRRGHARRPFPPPAPPGLDLPVGLAGLRRRHGLPRPSHPRRLESADYAKLPGTFAPGSFV